MKQYMLLAIMAFSFHFSFSQSIIIKVNYIKDEDNTIWTKGIDELTIRCNKNIVLSVNTDINGIAKIPKEIIIEGYKYDLSLTSIGISENFLTTIESKQEDTLFISLPKKYAMSFGYAICPKCKRSKHVCRISTEPILIQNIQNGDTIYSPIYKRTYYLGSSVSNAFNPLWYCKKDSIMF